MMSHSLRVLNKGVALRQATMAPLRSTGIDRANVYQLTLIQRTALRRVDRTGLLLVRPKKCYVQPSCL